MINGNLYQMFCELKIIQSLKIGIYGMPICKADEVNCARLKKKRKDKIIPI